MRRLTEPLRRRMKLMLSRAVGRLVDPSTLLQTLQLELLKGEVLDGIEHMEGYGRTANPPAGFEALAGSFGGDRAHTVAIACIHRQSRVRNLQPGEQAIYDDQGQVIALLRDKIIHIYGCDQLIADVAVETIVTCPLVRVVASEKVRFETPLLECTGEIKDRCDSDGKTMEAQRTTYDSHTHPENDNGGPTGTPTQQIG